MANETHCKECGKSLKRAGSARPRQYCSATCGSRARVRRKRAKDNVIQLVRRKTGEKLEPTRDRLDPRAESWRSEVLESVTSDSVTLSASDRELLDAAAVVLTRLLSLRAVLDREGVAADGKAHPLLRQEREQTRLFQSLTGPLKALTPAAAVVPPTNRFAGIGRRVNWRQANGRQG
jgi:hypothetical protein